MVILEKILEDSRQKIAQNANIKAQLEKLGYELTRTKLYVGDYTFPADQHICVDTKKDMNEIESNLIHDHERFRAECIRAKDVGIKLIILIQDDELKTMGDVFGWKNPRRYYSKRAVTGRTLAKIMVKMNHEYDVRFEFCRKQDCGKRIVELLNGG